MEREQQMYTHFIKVSRETGVPVKKVLDIFFFLSTGEPVDNNELLRKVGVSRNALNQIKKSLSFLLKPVSKDTQLTPQGLGKVGGLYPNTYLAEESLWSQLESEQYKEIVSLLQSIQKERPSAKRELDQFLATVETVARRTTLLDFFGDVKGKRLLFLGDADFTSIAVSRLKAAQRVVVVDIDERVLGAISKAAENQGLEIETLKHDVRKRPPRELKGEFDVVFTDPPYTPGGVEIFVSRAIEALDPANKSARIYACYGNSDMAKERFLPIYEIFTNSGLMARWVFDKFNRYQGAESIGNASSLFVTEVTPRTRPCIRGDYNQPIYTSD